MDMEYWVTTVLSQTEAVLSLLWVGSQIGVMQVLAVITVWQLELAAVPGHGDVVAMAD
jgi:hypothetical protein